MRGQIGLKSAGFSLLLIVLLILSFNRLLPSFNQPGVKEAQTFDTERTILDDTLVGVVEGDLSFSLKLSQHGINITEGQIYGDQELLSRKSLVDVVGSSQSLLA
jgi:hypothetical protein